MFNPCRRAAIKRRPAARSLFYLRIVLIFTASYMQRRCNRTILTLFFFLLLRARPSRKQSDPSFSDFSLTTECRRDCAASAARFFCLHPVLLSLSCVPAFSAGDSAPIFFFALPKKKTAAGGQKKKGALYGLDKGPIQPGFRVTEGAYSV